MDEMNRMHVVLVRCCIGCHCIVQLRLNMYPEWKVLYIRLFTSGFARETLLLDIHVSLSQCFALCRSSDLCWVRMGRHRNRE